MHYLYKDGLPSVGMPEHALLMQWLRLNGIDTRKIPADTEIYISGDSVYYTKFAVDLSGREYNHSDGTPAVEKWSKRIEVPWSGA